MKNGSGSSLIDFVVIFPMQSSEFTKALNFKGFPKKKNVHLKIDFSRYIIFL